MKLNESALKGDWRTFANLRHPTRKEHKVLTVAWLIAVQEGVVLECDYYNVWTTVPIKVVYNLVPNFPKL